MKGDIMKITNTLLFVISILLFGILLSLNGITLNRNVYAGREDIQKIDIVKLGGRTIHDYKIPVEIKK